MGKGGKKFEYKGIEYDSPEETYLAMWLEELTDSAYVRHWERNTDSFLLTPVFTNVYKEKLKKSLKTRSQTILQGWSYTPDFKIEWSKYSKGLFYNELGEKIKLPFIADKDISFVEVKPVFDRNNMTRLFRHAQKVMYKEHGIYVNLITPQKLFAETFTPTPYLKTKTGRDKKINFEIRTLEQYYHSINE